MHVQNCTCYHNLIVLIYQRSMFTLISLCEIWPRSQAQPAGERRAWYPLFAHTLNFPEIVDYCVISVQPWCQTSDIINRSAQLLLIKQRRTLFFALQRLGSSGMHLKPEQVASISAVCKGKDIFIWLPTGFGKSVCYKTTLFVIERYYLSWIVNWEELTANQESIAPVVVQF